MKSTHRRVLLIVVLFAVVGVAISCTVLTRRQSADVWTPAPVTRTTAQPTRTGAILPSPTASRSQVSPTSLLTATDTPRPTSTPALPTAVPTRRPPTAAASLKPTATADPHLIFITEADVVNSVASDAARQSGLAAENLTVRFTDGKMRLTASKLTYGPVQVQNLDLVGRLVAVNGQLQLQAESIAPRGLVAMLIPTVANQALAQLASQWYVEEVRTLEGRLEVRIR
ncbi:MAG: hypothetical protein NT169_07520 [Chloroflexi bacterium]|nr:hypothetical protein [Chloroflexota bacterium]